MAARLSAATEQGILPPSLLSRPEGPEFDFTTHYGDIADPRFAAAITQIDKAVDRESLLRPTE
jgi:hypothetical protein